MSELVYRRELEEKLKDLSGELKTGRETFTWNSGLYNKLDKSINAVLKVLEDHNGEETLSDEVRKDLEEKIQLRKWYEQSGAVHTGTKKNLIASHLRADIW